MSKKKVLLDALKYILFFGAGIALFIYVYRGQNINQIWQGLSSFNYGWVGAAFVVFVLSHLFRAMRWRMLIESIGYKPRLVNTFLSILVMYLANLAVTRSGEVARCGILKKYEGVPFTSQLGTVLIERIVDVIFLLIILFIVLAFEWDTLSSFVQTDAAMENNKLSFFRSPLFIGATGAFLVVVAVLYLFRRQLLRLSIAGKLVSYFLRFAEGLRSILKLRQPILFVILTIAIYGCYYLSTLFVFMAFGPTSELSPMVSFSVLAMGSIGMVLPVPGGAGTFDWFTIQTLTLYKVPLVPAQLVTLVLHGSTILFTIIVGAISLAILPVINKNQGTSNPG